MESQPQSQDIFSIDDDFNSLYINRKIKPLYKYIMASLIISIVSITLLFFFKASTGSEVLATNHYNYNLNKKITLDDQYSIDNLEKLFYTNKGITHDVFVKKIHSHNDYWRNTPLLDAISLGVQSVEADVWYFPENNDETVYVGHSMKSLKKGVTLDSLYINPLNAILKGSNNKQDDSADIIIKDNNDINGVFDTDHETTLYLFIDLKTDGNQLFDKIHSKFQNFHNNKWLSYYNETSDEFKWGPITIIGTGNTPLDKVKNQGEIRYIFFDGPLNKLKEVSEDEINYKVSPIVSSSLRMLVQQLEITDLLNDDQVKNIKELVEIAHKGNMKTRIWDTPWWPVNLKRGIWRQIINDIKSDYLNVDDLVEGVEFKW